VSRDIAILIPCWKSPELLEICVPSILESITTDSEIIVVLNEADEESIVILDSLGVRHIDKDRNYGPSAVDFAIPYIQGEGFKYVANVNSDMLFPKGWDTTVIRILEDRKPCSVSPTLVEPGSECRPPVRIQDEIEFFDRESSHIFNQNVEDGKYRTIEMRAFSHPIIVTTEDYLSVGGYSDGMDMRWVEVCGNKLDPYFGFRLYQIYGGNFTFIRTNDVFIYHNASYNRLKFRLLPLSGNSYFLQKTGISPHEFVQSIGLTA
jgi:glycosyltransferase involved in cell wall biosynthesis